MSRVRVSASTFATRAGVFASRAPGGWERYVHINGGVYFHHAGRRIITDNDMDDSRWREVVEQAGDEFRRDCRRLKIDEYVHDDADIIIRYYLGFWSNDKLPEPEDAPEILVVSHSDGTETTIVDEEERDVVIETGTYRFWTQIEEYPMHLQADSVLDRARATFLDAMTYVADERIFDSRGCMAPLTECQVERFMEIYNDLSDTAETNTVMIPVLIWFLARVIREVKAIQEGFAMQCAAADLELLGHAVKRSDLSSPGDETWQLRVARYVFGTLLLGSNTAYATRLQATRWGAGVHIEEFRHVLKQFLAEWTDSNLLATFFMGANIGLLSVPSISGVVRTGVVASAMFSVLSIGSGLYHVWNHRAKATVDALEAAKYVYHVQGRHGGGSSDLSDPVIMSFFLALPVASMMWALLCFFIALAALSIQMNEATRSGTALWVLSAVLSTAILVGVATVVHFKRIIGIQSRGSSHV